MRPLIMSPCWLIKNIISSFQVENIRRKEHWFLRKCLKIFKQENSVKYVNSKEFYKKAKVNRIDKELVKNIKKFMVRNSHFLCLVTAVFI